MVALAAAAVTVYGWHGARRQRGWLAWLAALWCNAAGLALAAVASEGARWPAALAAQALWLAWPALTLAGVRRFHARVQWPTTGRQDLMLVLLCAAWLATSPAWPADSAFAALAAPLAMLLVQLYVAGLIWSASSRPEAQALRLVALLMAGAAVAPMVSLGSAVDAPGLFERQALAIAFATLTMAFATIGLASERRERHWRESRRRLRVLAHIDSLTRVPNRRRFEELAGRALTHDAPGSAVLLMFDIDHFKRINDQFGHATGDRALRLVSQSLMQALRAQDVPGRQGGDEFTLLLRNASVREAMGVAERLVERVQNSGRLIGLPTLTLSFGVVQVRAVEGVEEALRRADQALYEAKRQGRARAVAASGNEQRPVFTESQRLGLTAA